MMSSREDRFEVMLRLKLPRGNFNLAVMNNLYRSSVDENALAVALP